MTEGPTTRRILSWFWHDHLRPRWPSLIAALLLMAVEGGSNGALSYLVRPMFDGIHQGAAPVVALYVALAIAAIFLARAATGFTHRVIMARQGEGVSTTMQQSLLTHLMTLDLGFFQHNPPGALIERLRGDNAALRNLWPPILQAAGRDVAALLSLLAVALSIDWRWTLLAVVGVPVIIGPLALLQTRVRKAARQARVAAAVLSTRLDETFHGIRTLQLTGTEAQEASRYRRALDHYLALQIRAETSAAGIPALIDLVAAFGFAGVMYFGGLEIIAGTKSLGQFMSFFTAMALVFEPLRRLGWVSGGWAQARASLERMRDLLDEKPGLTSPLNPEPIPHGAGLRLALNNVRFSYGDALVLDGVSLTAEPGQTTALVGPSGSGKTTVFNLLTRMADPQSGSVTLGGIDLRRLALSDLRAQFAVVSQDSALFDEPLSVNIRMGAQDQSDAALARALTDANAMDFVAALPQGSDTPAGPRGSALSGGQRQRIAIARAVLRNAPVLLLDEATSALDAQSELLVTEALARLGQGRTTLVIAHRLATVRMADKIVVMNAGRVVDQGTHDDLLARGGLYADLYRLQFKD